MSRPSNVYLSEEQNASFDAEYHSQPELCDKLTTLSNYLGTRKNDTLRILDIGGGNGQFLDTVLNHLPNSMGALVDISPVLIRANRPHARKSIIYGDLYKIKELLEGQRFDIVFVNWVLHHLVGQSYPESVRRVVCLLQSVGAFLTENGLVVVAENLYNGWFRSNIPSKLIFAITSISNPFVVAATRRFANTAGVGVCFQSEKAWVKIFLECGFEEVIERKYGDYWRLPISRRAGLLISTIRHGHFFLAQERDRSG